jgi:hypothetical protein
VRYKPLGDGARQRLLDGRIASSLRQDVDDFKLFGAFVLKVHCIVNNLVLLALFNSLKAIAYQNTDRFHQCVMHGVGYSPLLGVSTSFRSVIQTRGMMLSFYEWRRTF